MYTDQQLYGLRLSMVWWFTVTLITLAAITDSDGTPQANKLYLTNLEISTFTGSGRGLRFTLLRNVINISYVITHSQLIMARRRQCIPNAKHKQRLSSWKVETYINYNKIKLVTIANMIYDLLLIELIHFTIIDIRYHSTPARKKCTNVK